MKSNEKLSQRQRDERDKLITLLPKIGETYRLKLLFDDFWYLKDEEDAQGFF